jgi:hypothetical protein
VSSFGRFWWEFLVGDTPELFVGAVIAVAVVALLAHHGVARTVTVIVLPVMVVGLLSLSVRAARRQVGQDGTPPPESASD